MTREEAINQLKDFTILHRGEHGWDISTLDALDMAIKALEDKDVLDKIRAEIEQLPTNTRINWDGCCPDIDYPQIEYVDVTKDKLLSIIDKYKTESEEVK